MRSNFSSNSKLMKGLYRGLAGRRCSSDKSKWLWQNISRVGGSPKPQARPHSLAPFGLHHGLLSCKDVFHVLRVPLNEGTSFPKPPGKRGSSPMCFGHVEALCCQLTQETEHFSKPRRRGFGSSSQVSHRVVSNTGTNRPGLPRTGKTHVL